MAAFKSVLADLGSSLKIALITSWICRTPLLALMYLLAQAHDIEFFTGSVLVQNHHFWRRLQHLGAEATQQSGGVIEFKMPIHQKFSDLPENDFTPRWKNLLETMGKTLFCSNEG